MAFCYIWWICAPPALSDFVHLQLWFECSTIRQSFQRNGPVTWFSFNTSLALVFVSSRSVQLNERYTCTQLTYPNRRDFSPHWIQTSDVVLSYWWSVSLTWCVGDIGACRNTGLAGTRKITLLKHRWNPISNDLRGDIINIVFFRQFGWRSTENKEGVTKSVLFRLKK